MPTGRWEGCCALGGALARALLSKAVPSSGSSRDATPHTKGTVTWCQPDRQARSLIAGKNVLFPLFKLINMVLSHALKM